MKLSQQDLDIIMCFVCVLAGFALGAGIMLQAGKDIAVAKAVVNGNPCVLQYPEAADYFNGTLRAALMTNDSLMGYTNPDQEYYLTS